VNGVRWLTGLLASATAVAVVVVSVCAVAASMGGIANPRPTSAGRTAPHLRPAYGDAGSTVTVVGHRFTPRSTVYVAGHPVPTTYKTHREVAFSMPESPYAQTDVAVRTGGRTTWIGLFTYGGIAEIPPMGDTALPSEGPSPSDDATPHSAGNARLCDGIHGQADANDQARGIAVAYATVVVGPAEPDPQYPDGSLSTDMRLLPVAHAWLLAGRLPDGAISYLSETAGSDGIAYTPPGTYSVLLMKDGRSGVYTPAYGVAGTFSQTDMKLVQRCDPDDLTPGITNPAHLLSLFRTALAKR